MCEALVLLLHAVKEIYVQRITHLVRVRFIGATVSLQRDDAQGMCLKRNQLKQSYLNNNINRS